MSLLDLIEQQHAMRLLGDGFREQAALVEAHVARRCTDQTRYGVALHVLGHVETYQFDPQSLGQLARSFGFTDAGRPCKQERANRFVGGLETGTGKLDRRRQRINRCVLTEHGHSQVPLQITQQLFVRAGYMLWRNTCDFRNDIFDLCHLDALDALLDWLQALISTRFVDDIDGLVRHVPVIDVA